MVAPVVLWAGCFQGAGLKYRCPQCGAPINAQLQCTNGHPFGRKDGVLRLLEPSFRERLDQYLENYEKMRQKMGARLTDESQYPKLPFFDLPKDPYLWLVRRIDLKVIEAQLPPGNQKVLEIGAWNGWLSYRLTLAGHSVTAVDYFLDPYDGLSAMGHYPVSWNAIQMDLERPDLLAESFDVIIVNRCIHSMTEPTAYLMQLRDLLVPGGLLLITGLNFFFNPAERLEFLEHLKRQCWETCRFEPFFKPLKGYLDAADRRAMRALDIEIRPYRSLWWENLKAMMRPTRARQCFGLYRKS